MFFVRIKLELTFSQSWASQEAEESSTPNRRDIDERPTVKNITIEWDDGDKGHSNLILTEIFPTVYET